MLTPQAELAAGSETARPGEHESERRIADELNPDGAPRTKAVKMTPRSTEDALAIAERLQVRIGADRFARWFGTAQNFTLHDDELEVRVANRSTGGLLERRFREMIREEGREATGREVTLRVRIEPGDAAAGRETAPTAPMAREAARETHGGSGAAGASARKTISRTLPGDRFRLETFVVGESNRLAYSAAVQMAESIVDPRSDQPTCTRVFLHGPCGVGKTHLLQGIAIRFKERHPGAQVRVTSGEQFMNDFVSMIRAGTTGGVSGPERFRRAYRKLDLLCIDDVHFLASKQATQMELLSTFDELERAGARIALASDMAPRQLSKFSLGLVSRFSAGMVSSIGAPDAELRGMLIRTFCAARGLGLDPAALAYLIERTAGAPGSHACSIRDLEGVVTKIEALHRLIPDDPPRAGGAGKLTLGLVSRALDETGQGGGGQGGRPVRMELLIDQVCTILSVSTADLGAKTRHKRVVLARALITHLAREHTTLSYPEIARAIGRPNHSTVITAHQRLLKQVAADEALEFGSVGEASTVPAVVRLIAQAVLRESRRG